MLRHYMLPRFLYTDIPGRKKRIVILLAFITALIASWAIPLRYPGTGLDPSWAQALVEATDSGRIFGKEIIFTYGPLHQAITAQVSTNLAPLLFSRLAFSVIWLTAQILIGTLLGCRAEASIALAVLISAGSRRDIPFYLIALLGIAAPAAARLRIADKYKSHSLLLSVTLLSGSLLATLAKLSYVGSFVPVFAYAAGTYALDAYKQKSAQSLARLAIILAVPPLVLLGAWSVHSKGSIGSLFNYYLGPNLEIIQGYTDAMSFGHATGSILNAFAFLFTFAVLLTLFSSLVLGVKISRLRMRQRASDPADWFCMACLSVLGWIIFKSSYVRNDSGHTLLGAFFLACFLLVVIGFSRRESDMSLATASGRQVVFGVSVSILTTTYLAILSGYRISPGIALKYAQGLFDSYRLFSPGGQKRLMTERENALAKIRHDAEDYRIAEGSSADVIPWDISYLIANRLTYKPRPIPQSYTVYSRNLQEINKRFFADPKMSPDWVIVGIKDIDSRLPIGLDSPSLRALKHFYAFSHKGSEGSLVFRKRTTVEGEEFPAPTSKICAGSSQGRLEWRKTGPLGWQTKPLEIAGKSRGLSILDTEFKDSLTRSVLSTFYRPFPLVLEYLDANGSIISSHRIIPKAGREIIIYPLIKGNDAFLRSVYLGMPAFQGINDKIVSLRLSTRNVMPPFSRSKYVISFDCSNP